MSVYGLKHATPKMKYQHMIFMMEWKKNLAISQLNPSDREQAIEMIKQLMDDYDEFIWWFKDTYKIEPWQDYERAIYDKLDSLVKAKEAAEKDGE